MTSETDAEFVERMGRAIPYNSHLLKSVDLSRLFAIARRGAEAGKLLAEQDHEYNRKTNDLIARHAEQLARRGAAVQWRPISEAPKDGTAILLLIQFPGEPPDTFVATWDVNSPKWPWRPTCDGSAYSEEYATHWMPLPSPPAGEPSDE